MPIFSMPVVLHANCPHANSPHANNYYPSTMIYMRNRSPTKMNRQLKEQVERLSSGTPSKTEVMRQLWTLILIIDFFLYVMSGEGLKSDSYRNGERNERNRKTKIEIQVRIGEVITEEHDGWTIHQSQEEQNKMEINGCPRPGGYDHR